MKLASQMIAVASMTTLFAGGALAGMSQGTTAQSAIATSTPEEIQSGYDATERFPKTSWERGELLALMKDGGMIEQPTEQPIMKQTWERGQLINLLRKQRKGIGGPDIDVANVAPRVVIYFDATGTEPGLMHDLGNTHAGRSIMLRYLEQARTNAKQS